MTLPSQSQFDSALTKTDLAEIFKCRKIRTTGALLRIRSSREAAAARQPDRMGQRHSLRPVRPRSRPGPLATGPYVVFLQQSGRYPWDAETRSWGTLQTAIFAKVSTGALIRGEFIHGQTYTQYKGIVRRRY